MKPILFYLLQVIVASGLLYAYYHFALRNKKFHRYNRFYLLMAVVVSSLIPFLNIPVYFSLQETESSVVLQTLQVISSPSLSDVNLTASPVTQTPSIKAAWFTGEKIIYLFYFFILLFFLLKVLVSLSKIRSIIKRNRVEQLGTVKFVNTDEPGTPFSFFRWLFWNKKIELHSEKGEQIFRHELFHIQQRHSWDIIFIELVSTIFWINPFFHLIKKELKAIHEFLADEFAVKENKNWQYAELLLMQALNTNNRLVNPFFHNQIKRRIAMITTSQKPSYRYLRKLMVLPVAAIIIFLFAFNYKNKQRDPHEVEKANNSITVVIDAGHGGTDNGVKSPDGKYSESKLCLQIAQKIEELGSDYNIKVILTRSNEALPGEAKTKTEALKKRLEIARQFNPDVFISLHLDVEGTYKNFQTKSSGFLAYISDEKPGDRNILLAKTVLAELKSIYATDLGVRQREGQGIYVLDKNIVPAILLECGYINNAKDLAFVSNDKSQEEIARAILKGLVNFANNIPNDHKLNFQNPPPDTSKLLNNALIIINGVIQEKRGIQNIDTTKFPNKEFKGSSNAFWGKEAVEKYGEKGKHGVIEFFYDQNGNQIIDTIPKVDTIYWIKNPETPAKRSPSAEQLKLWTDAKTYGVWLDGKRIANNELNKYRPSDFGLYSVSKLARTAVNYGKHFVQIDLYTHKHYEKVYMNSIARKPYLVREITLLNSSRSPQPLIVVNDDPMPGLTIETVKKHLPENSIVTQTILNEQDAAKKYGEKGKYGAIEIRAKNWDNHIRSMTIYHSDATLLDDDNKVFVKVEVEAAFPGGATEWRKYIQRNIDATVPVKNGAKAGTYTVVVQFIVDKEGRVSDVRALSNHGFGMEEEAIRMIDKGPNWIPAIQNGHKVKAYRKQPFTFVVAEDTKNEPLSSNSFDPSGNNFNDPEFRRKWREMISQIKAIAWKEGKAAYVYKGRTYVFGRIVNPDSTVASFTEQNGTDHVFLLDGELINSVDELNKLVKRSDVKKFGFINKDEALNRFHRKDAIVFIETFNEVITKN